MLPWWRSTCAAAMLLAAISPGHAHGQGSASDYDRAATLAERMHDKVQNAAVRVHWLGDGSNLWYERVIAPDTREYILVDAESGEKRPALDATKLAAALSKPTGKEITADELHVRGLWLSDDLATARFDAAGKHWECKLNDYTLRDLEEERGQQTTVRVLDNFQRSRDGGPETSVRFVNRTDNPVKLYWVDGSGNRAPYGSIPAGEDRDQHTFSGHVWLVTDSRERPLAVFEAANDAGTAVIDGSSRGPSPLRGMLRGFLDSGRDRRARDRSRGANSPDGKWRATIVDHEVVLRARDGDERVPLSDDGSAADSYVPRFAWSLDSKKLVVIQERAGRRREVNIIEAAPRNQLQPRLHTYKYAKPGDRLPVPRPRLFDIASRKQIPIDNDLFPTPWSVSELEWQSDSRRFSFLYNQRGHQVLRLVVVDADTGSTGTLIDEQSDTFIDYADKQYLHRLNDTGEIIWMSERDGWNHLYLYDVRTGDLKNQVTRGTWVVRGVDQVDEENRQIWFRAGGIYPEQDPYYLHFCRINFDGTGLTILTNGNGTHSIDFSPDRQFIVDTWSRVDLPPVTELRRADDGTLVCELESADDQPLVEAGWQAPQRFVAKGRDGETDIYGVIYRPTNFDSEKKYPVIEKIYAGPQGAFVPKAFAAIHDTQPLAELGFIVVQIDGMGTSHRSKKFHDVCWKNLGDSGFPDRIAWLKTAAKEHPEMDLARVGIYGGSAGGQSALRALLAHGDFYKAAVADCGCHDNRMDKVWWNELWMGWPIGPHYEEQSNVTQAKNLKGDLLLIVGELDRNVDPASTMQVVDALVRADKDFELLVIPGAGHGAGGGPYGTRRTRDFFVRRLLGVEPRWTTNPEGSENE